MSVLEHAISIAVCAHAGEVSENGEPYILHPLRVMLSMQTNEERVVAVLHDVVEKTRWDLQNLRAEGFDVTLIEAVDSVSRHKEESYDDFVKRTKLNPIGRRVKIADLKDNIDAVTSGRNPAKASNLTKYENALSVLCG